MRNKIFQITIIIQHLRNMYVTYTLYCILIIIRINNYYYNIILLYYNTTINFLILIVL